MLQMGALILLFFQNNSRGLIGRGCRRNRDIRLVAVQISIHDFTVEY